MFVQKIKKVYSTGMDIAEKYYSVLSILNDLNLTNREIQLLAYTSVRGTISSKPARDEYCKKYGSSLATVNNMMSSLRKKGLLVKENTKLRVNPVISPNFSQDLGLVITLVNGEDK